VNLSNAQMILIEEITKEYDQSGKQEGPPTEADHLEALSIARFLHFFQTSLGLLNWIKWLFVSPS
jgi:hypothetical protein